MSRELLGEDPDAPAAPPGTPATPADALVADLDPPSKPAAVPPDQREPADAPAPRNPPPPAPTGGRPQPRPLVAIVVGILFAAAVASLAGYTQTRRAVNKNALRTSAVTIWPEAGRPPQPGGPGQLVTVQLSLVSTGAEPVTINRIDVGEMKLDPQREVRLQPGERASAEFSYLPDCGYPASTTFGTASAHDSQGESLRLRVTLAGSLTEFLTSVSCYLDPPVEVKDMIARPDGRLTFTLASPDGALPTEVKFGIGGPDRSATGAGPWWLQADPGTRIWVAGGDQVRVVLRLRYRGCLRDGPLPSTDGLIRVSARTRLGEDQLTLAGWDESAVSAAAAAAVLSSC